MDCTGSKSKPFGKTQNKEFSLFLYWTKMKTTFCGAGKGENIFIFLDFVILSSKF